MMSENTPGDQQGWLSPQERKQINYLLRFLATVLVCVLLASLFAGILISIFQNG
ncbi:MAG: hypothetical protein H7X77_03420 [Anaerolineae bacterium]|nr:hypothetical protein [Anaerolineae bacterium]